MNITHLPDKNTYQPFAHSQQRFTTASLIVLLMNSINSLCFSPSFSPSVADVPLFFLFFFFPPLTSTLPLCLSSPLCPLEHRLKMNCWLQLAVAMLRENGAVWWQITAKRVGDGLNCVPFTWSPACFLFLSRSVSLLLAAFTHLLLLN